MRRGRRRRRPPPLSPPQQVSTRYRQVTPPQRSTRAREIVHSLTASPIGVTFLCALLSPCVGSKQTGEGCALCCGGLRRGGACQAMRSDRCAPMAKGRRTSTVSFGQLGEWSSRLPLPRQQSPLLLTRPPLPSLPPPPSLLFIPSRMLPRFLRVEITPTQILYCETNTANAHLKMRIAIPCAPLGVHPRTTTGLPFHSSKRPLKKQFYIYTNDYQSPVHYCYSFFQEEGNASGFHGRRRLECREGCRQATEAGGN